MEKLGKYIKFTPLLLFAVVAASVLLYRSEWWGDVYPYVLQIYTAIPLGVLLYYSIKQKHPIYLRILYIGLIDINVLNCVVLYFKVDNWMPYIVIVLVITVILALVIKRERFTK